MPQKFLGIGKRRTITLCAGFVLLVFVAFGAISYFSSGVSKYIKVAGNADQSALASEVYPLPKSNPPATSFYVTSTGGQGDPMSYTMAAVSGLVARDKPQLFLLQSSGDDAWLSYIEKTYGMQATSISNEQALKQFASYYENGDGQVNVIEYDSNDSFFPMQVNMAATLAGVYDAIPVANSEISTIDSIFGASNVNIEYDLVGMFSGTNESQVKVEAYSWLWNLTASQTTRSFFSMNPEGRPDLDDYVVEFKAFQFEFCCVNLNAVGNQAPPLTTPEMAFVTKVLSSYPPNTVDVGYIGLGSEVYTIQILSQFGMSEIADPELSDLSFYSGFPTLTNLSQAPSTQTALTYNPSQTYVLFEFTQGDALTFDAYTNWNLYNAVDPSSGAPYRDEVPAAWQINPIMAVIAPPIMKAYYSEQQGSLDDFIPGPSGGSGYDHPDQMGQYEADQNALSREVSQNAGMDVSFAILGNPFSPSVDQTFAEQVQPKGVLLWQNSGHPPVIVDGVPFMTSSFWVNVNGSFTPTDVSNTVSEIQSYSSSSHFVYVIMNAQNPGLPFVSQVVAALGSGYTAVNAGQYIDLYCQSQEPACATITQNSVQSAGESSPTNLTSTTASAGNSAVNEGSASKGTNGLIVDNSQTHIGVESENIRTVAATLAVGTSASIFLIGLFPLLYFTKRRPIRRYR